MAVTCNVARKEITIDGFDYHLKLWLKDYIVQDGNHSDAYRERFGLNCCNSHKYKGQDIRELLKEYY